MEFHISFQRQIQDIPENPNSIYRCIQASNRWGKDEKIRNTRLLVRARLRTLDGIRYIVSQRDYGKFNILIVMPPRWVESLSEFGGRVWKYPLMITKTSL
jgi:hypothetical protein